MYRFRTLYLTLLGIGILAVLLCWKFTEKEDAPVNEATLPLVGEIGESPTSEGESPAYKEKVEELETQPHYNTNVAEREIQREGVFKRTSYYDTPIGSIESKAVGLSEVIYAGASELNMRRGVATVEYQEQLDELTVAIAGHRSRNRTQFLTGALYLEVGDEILIHQYKKDTTEIEKTTVFVVEDRFSVLPSDVSVLKDAGGQERRKLVLITCYKFNPETQLYDERYIVTAYEKAVR